MSFTLENDNVSHGMSSRCNIGDIVAAEAVEDAAVALARVVAGVTERRLAGICSAGAVMVAPAIHNTQCEQ